MEDLHGQVVRLKRHRDKLMRDQRELSRELAETRLELQSVQLKAVDAQVRGRTWRHACAWKRSVWTVRVETRMRMGALWQKARMKACMWMGALCVDSAHGRVHAHGSALCIRRAWRHACAWEHSVWKARMEACARMKALCVDSARGGMHAHSSTLCRKHACARQGSV
jgi:hypothetical protein